jgi:hypothetical protein
VAISDLPIVFTLRREHRKHQHKYEEIHETFIAHLRRLRLF